MPRTKALKCNGTAAGQQLIASLTEFRDALKAGKRNEEQFTVHRVELDLTPKQFDAKAIQRLRVSLNASQAVFAQILGATPATVQAWEQGRRKPTQMANRLLEEVAKNLVDWKRRLKQATRHKDLR